MEKREAEMKELVIEMDKKMSARSFKYFFETVLGFDYADHHGLWDKGLTDNRYYCVKASRDHGKSVFFMSYALWLAAFNPGKHIMIFSHSLEQTLEHMRFIRGNIDTSPCLQELKPGGIPWRKTYFEFTNGSRIMAKSVGGGTRGFHPDVVLCDDILWGTTGSELQRAADWWPERWSLDALDQRRMSMPAIQFTREYLCEPIHDVASMFPMELLEKARDHNLKILDHAERDFNEEGEDIGVFGQHFIGWDTAIASDKNADFTAMTVMRTIPDEDIKQIVGIVHEKGMSSVAQKRQIIILNNKFQPDLIELEGNNFQRMFAMELQDIRQDIPIRTFMTTRTKKESLFMSLLLAFEQGQIKTPYGDERSKRFTHKLEEELNRFGMQKSGRLESVGTHDDLAMSLALANWATKEFRGSVVMLDDYMPGFDEWITGKPRKKDGWMIP